MGAVEFWRINATPLRATMIESSPNIQWRLMLIKKSLLIIISGLFHLGLFF
jgi:hypothetical protein